MLWCLASIALATPAELASGQDLTAIRAIEDSRLEGDEAIEAWRAFLLAFSDSPLASEAYRMLVALGGFEGDWIPADRQGAVARVARAAASEDAEAARPLLTSIPADLHPDGTPVMSVGPTWAARMGAHMGWDGLPYGATEVGLHRGVASGILRVGKQRAWYAELAGRLHGPLSFGPWVEVHVDSLRRAGLSAGGEVAVSERVALEARTGFLTDGGELIPRIATALIVRIPEPFPVRGRQAR